MSPLIRLHSKILNNVSGLVKENLGVKLQTGWEYAMFPDLALGSHGYDVNTGNGSIVKEIMCCANPIYSNIVFNQSNMVHYIADALSIGQISSDFWGFKDNMIDFKMEFHKYPKVEFADVIKYQDREGIENLADLEYQIKYEMREVYKFNQELLNNSVWKYLWSNKFEVMRLNLYRKAVILSYIGIWLSEKGELE